MPFAENPEPVGLTDEHTDAMSAQIRANEQRMNDPNHAEIVRREERPQSDHPMDKALAIFNSRAGDLEKQLRIADQLNLSNPAAQEARAALQEARAKFPEAVSDAVLASKGALADVTPEEANQARQAAIDNTLGEEGYAALERDSDHLLAVADNLTRALEAAKAGDHQQDIMIADATLKELNIRNTGPDTMPTQNLDASKTAQADKKPNLWERMKSLLD